MITRLIFFDIDATLITTDRSGIKAMLQAGQEMFGPRFNVDRIEFAGRLDPLIIADVLRDQGLDPTPQRMEAFRDGYRKYLALRLADPATKSITLPGVMELLQALQPVDHIARALLTGNYPDTGSLKLRACGIEPDDFQLHVWGDQSPSSPPTRNDLPGIGLARYRERFGRAIDPCEAVVIGDTPHDVRCAHAHGCRAIGVATGPFSVDQLRAAGAEHVLPTLADTTALLRWLGA